MELCAFAHDKRNRSFPHRKESPLQSPIKQKNQRDSKK